MKPHLVARVASPPGQTFEQFFAQSWPFAFRLAAFITQDQEAGEEIAQEAMTRLYATWSTVDRPEAYLRTVIVNTATNWQRRRATRRTKLPLVSQPEAVDFVAEELADALAALPVRQRTVLVLRYYADLSEAEIAETLGCRPGTVKSLASRALHRLSKEIPQ
jgi:RNA polymerase sigma-70 factor (sigma-E family)